MHIAPKGLIARQSQYSDEHNCGGANHSGLQLTFIQISVHEMVRGRGWHLWRPNCVAGLRLNHPEAVPSDHSFHLKALTTVLDEFCDVTPFDEITINPVAVSSIPGTSTDMSVLSPPASTSALSPPAGTSALSPAAV